MKTEFEQLQRAEGWQLADMPKEKNWTSEQGKWRLALKRDCGGGNIIKHKARYVSRGFKQKQSFDLEETFSSTAKKDANRF